jgi:SAM-dependent methyltransferase
MSLEVPFLVLVLASCPHRPEEVLSVLQLKPGEVVADIGCGDGWLSKHAAKAVGEEGKVFAVEIDERMVAQLNKLKIANIEAVHSIKTDIQLPANTLDVAFLHDVASHVHKDSRPEFYASIQRALKNKTRTQAAGRLVLFVHHNRGREIFDQLMQYGFRPEDEQALLALSKSEIDSRMAKGVVFRVRPQRRKAV